MKTVILALLSFAFAGCASSGDCSGVSEFKIESICGGAQDVLFATSGIYIYPGSVPNSETVEDSGSNQISKCQQVQPGYFTVTATGVATCDFVINTASAEPSPVPSPSP